MLTRIVIVVLILALILVARALLHRRQRRGATTMPGITPGQPAIVYFSSRHCRQCAMQKSILDRVFAEAGEAVQLINIDAETDREAARNWQVLTVPTIVILDRLGKAIAVNNGIVNQQQLGRQLKAALAGSV